MRSAAVYVIIASVCIVNPTLSTLQVLLRFTHLPTGTFRLVPGSYSEDKDTLELGGCPWRMVTCTAPSFSGEGPGAVTLSISFDGTYFTPPAAVPITYYEEPALLEVVYYFFLFENDYYSDSS